MKKWLLFLIIFIMIATMITPMIAQATYDHECPVCEIIGIWTGQTKYEWGHNFWLYKCINKHYWWERQD